MSLINDMLKSLEQNRPAAPNVGDPSVPLVGSSGTKMWLLMAFAVVAVAYWLLVVGLMPAKESTTADVPPPIAMNPKWLDAANDPGVIAAAGPASVNASGRGETSNVGEPTDNRESDNIENPLAEATKDVGGSAHSAIRAGPTDLAQQEAVGPDVSQENEVATIEELLSRAAEALAQDRLTVPVDDNAYQWYRRVRALDPDNERALKGVSQVQARYSQLFDRALADQNWPRAKRHLGKMKQVAADASVIRSLSERLKDAQPTAAPGQSIATGTPPKSAGISVAAEEQDRWLADKLRIESLARWENKALEWIAASDVHGLTAMKLSDRYFDLGMGAQLTHLVALLQDQGSDYIHYARARWLMGEGRSEQAMRELKTASYLGAGEIGRLRLLGALLQSNRDYQQSLEVYAGLVQENGVHANDWLGLATALDSLGHASQARTAYQQVIQLRHTDERVIRFALKRSRELSYALNDR